MPSITLLFTSSQVGPEGRFLCGYQAKTSENVTMSVNACDELNWRTMELRPCRSSNSSECVRCPQQSLGKEIWAVAFSEETGRVWDYGVFKLFFLILCIFHLSTINSCRFYNIRNTAFKPDGLGKAGCDWFQLTSLRLVRAWLLCHQFPVGSRQIPRKQMEHRPLVCLFLVTHLKIQPLFTKERGLEIASLCFFKV